MIWTDTKIQHAGKLIAMEVTTTTKLHKNIFWCIIAGDNQMFYQSKGCRSI